MLTQDLMERLDVPKGWRTEIIDGNIVVSFPQTIGHAHRVSRINMVVTRAEPTGSIALQWSTVEFAATGDRYVPDLTVLPESVVDGEGWNGPDWIRPAEALALAVEVVYPSSRLHDWQAKVKGYATAGVPLYLVIDPHKSEIALYSNPEKGEYKDVARAVRGASVKLPEPFNLEIEATPLLTWQHSCGGFTGPTRPGTSPRTPTAPRGCPPGGPGPRGPRRSGPPAPAPSGRA